MSLSNLVTLKDSDRAECGLKIFGIAVGLLILMATVALLSMLMTRSVDSLRPCHRGSRPDEILVVMAIADGGRLLNRCGTEPIR